MVKTILIAIWVCAVMASSVYATVLFRAAPAEDAAADEFFGGLDYVKSDIISVPIISDGKIGGYVVAQFVFTIDGTILRKLSVPPNVFIIDEAFRALFAGETVDFKDMKKYDLEGLKKKIVVNVNKRFKSDLVRDVLIERLNFIPLDKVRYGPKR
ncbi:MAG: hypothetical protein HKN05_18870 [Rhizobiales bacterium]|nr:hypothetical protein [Hyphomicrobiales bacterium]